MNVHPEPVASFTSFFGSQEVATMALPPALRMSDHVLIVHALLACLAWAFLLPIGSILLRLNIPSASLLKLHGYCQMFSYFIYIVATGLGIWLAIQSAKFKPTWSDPHIIIGLLILGVALFQPFLGLIHHELFKKQLLKWKTGFSMQKPGRTVFSRIHVWIGRILLTFGVINGGLGIRLAGKSPFQDAAATKDVYLGYGIAAGLIWLLWASVSVVFEYRRSARERREREEERQMAEGAILLSEDRSQEELKYVTQEVQVVEDRKKVNMA